MAYRNILIPVDGSKSAFEALEKGIEMAKGAKAKATALYVVPKAAHFIEAFNIKNIRDSLHEEGHKILDRAREVAKEMDFAVSIRKDEGSPHERIVETAKMLGCDLIVMGSHGHSTPAKFLLGSCTQRVVASAPCPVLVVRD